MSTALFPPAPVSTWLVPLDDTADGVVRHCVRVSGHDAGELERLFATWLLERPLPRVPHD